mgnify:CR=1 FL=1
MRKDENCVVRNCQTLNEKLYYTQRIFWIEEIWTFLLKNVTFLLLFHTSGHFLKNLFHLYQKPLLIVIKIYPWLRQNREKKSRNFRFLEPGFYYQKSNFSFSLMKYIVISANFKNDIFKSVKFRDFFSLFLWRNQDYFFHGFMFSQV